MARRRPRLDLSLPDSCRQVAEFCAEFPHHRYEDILRTCRAVEIQLGRVRRAARKQRTTEA